MWRRVARLSLAALLVCSLATSALSAWSLFRSPVGSLLIERGQEEIDAALERMLFMEASPERTGARLAALLAETPRDWAAIDAIMALATEQARLHPEQGPNPPTDIATAVAAARDEDHGWFQSAGDCAACAWDVAKCELNGMLACNIAPQLTPFGDIASLASESTHYARGEPVDEINLLLSLVGLGATAITPLTGGAAAPVKTGAGIAKTAYRLGSLSEPVLRAGRRAAREGIDWSMLSKARPSSFSDDVARALRPDAIRPAIEFVENAEGLRASTSLTDSIVLLRQVESLEDARRMNLLAKTLGSRTTGAFEMVGKSKLFKLTHRIAEAVWRLAGSIAAAVAALIGLCLGVVKSMAMRKLRGIAGKAT